MQRECDIMRGSKRRTGRRKTLDTTEAIHKRVAAIVERYRDLTDEELRAMKKGMQEFYGHAVIDGRFNDGYRASDSITAILTIERERKEAGN